MNTDEKLDHLIEKIADLQTRIGILSERVNGGPGKGEEGLRHRNQIDELRGQLRFYAGALAILYVVLNFVAPVVIKHLKI
jgi:hypothetical protein